MEDYKRPPTNITYRKHVISSYYKEGSRRTRAKKYQKSAHRNDSSHVSYFHLLFPDDGPLQKFKYTNKQSSIEAQTLNLLLAREEGYPLYYKGYCSFSWTEANLKDSNLEEQGFCNEKNKVKLCQHIHTNKFKLNLKTYLQQL